MMIGRHMNELLSRLEMVEDLGCATVRKGELLRWYGQDRISVNIWRDILDKWEEIADAPLLVGGISVEDDPLVFIWGQGLKDSEQSWFKNITRLARRDEGNDGKAA